MPVVGHLLGGGGVERLNTLWTPGGLALLAGLVGAATLLSQPIQCHTPAYSTASHDGYLEAACYGSEYYLPISLDSQVPPENQTRGHKHLAYYRWVPLYLLCQALLFYIPAAVWTAMQYLCNHNVAALQATASRCASHEEISRRRHFRSLARIIRGSGAPGCRLVACSIVYRLLLLVGAMGQLVWMNRFVGCEYGAHGLEALWGTARPENPPPDYPFPKVILCDYQIRTLGNVHRNTVQCTLVLAPMYRAVYVLVWLWVLYVATVNLVSFSNLLVSMAVPSAQRHYVTSRLAAMGDCQMGETSLSKDEYFIVRRLAEADVLVGAELLLGFEDYHRQEAAYTGRTGTLESNKQLPSQQLYPHI